MDLWSHIPGRKAMRFSLAHKVNMGGVANLIRVEYLLQVSKMGKKDQGRQTEITNDYRE